MSPRRFAITTHYPGLRRVRVIFEPKGGTVVATFLAEDGRVLARPAADTESRLYDAAEVRDGDITAATACAWFYQHVIKNRLPNPTPEQRRSWKIEPY